MKLFFIAIFISLFCFLPGQSRAATLSLLSNTNQAGLKSPIVVKVTVNSENKPINAISGTIIFPANLLSVSNISTNKSILTLWVTPPIVRNNSISFAGVILNPGYTGNAGTILSITFTPNKIGSGQLKLSAVQILANDGSATNVFYKSNTQNLKIVDLPKKLISKTTTNTTTPAKKNDLIISLVLPVTPNALTPSSTNEMQESDEERVEFNTDNKEVEENQFFSITVNTQFNRYVLLEIFVANQTTTPLFTYLRQSNNEGNLQFTNINLPRGKYVAVAKLKKIDGADIFSVSKPIIVISNDKFLANQTNTKISFIITGALLFFISLLALLLIKK
ncbi:MAG: hypothetical protein WCK11_03640 [Candidatus Falkowbacteria bacterium]